MKGNVWRCARVAGRPAALLAWSSAMVAAQKALESRRDVRVCESAYLRVWAKGVVSLCGVRPRGLSSALQVAPATQDDRSPAHGRLVVSNHRSPLDIPLLLAVFGGRLVSRDDLARWPVLGWFAHHAGTIFVDRQNANSGAAAIRAVRAALKAGDTVLVFPEGGTFAGDRVRSFREGAFSAASRLDVDIIPVGLAYEPDAELSNESLGDYWKRIGGTAEIPVGISVGSPRKASRGSAKASSAELHTEVQSRVGDARALLSNSVRK